MTVRWAITPTMVNFNMPYFRAHCNDSLSITVDYGYDIHSISITATEWQRICSGKPVRLAGHGFYCEGEKTKDTWEINTQRPGSISVVYDAEAEIYDGDLSDIEVAATDPGGKAVMLPDFS